MRRPSPCRPCCRRCSATMPITRGWCMSPSGFFSILMLVLVGALLGRGTDARWLIAAGLVIMAAGSYWMALMNLEISPWQVVWPRVVTIVGLSLIFAPVNVAAFLYMPAPARGGGGPARLVAERGRQFRHVDGPDDPGTPGAVPPLPSGRYPRPIEPPRSLVPRTRASLFPAAHGRPRRVATDGCASARQPPPAAGRVAGLLRRVSGCAPRWGRHWSCWCC